MASKAAQKLAKCGVEDLVLMAKINEANIVTNLQKRYMADLIYTNIGSVLISVNPFKRIPITGPEWVDMYRGKFRHELQPHIYALAEEAHRGIRLERQNQCVIISGESGAGKTEAAKLIMGYISAVTGSDPVIERVKNVILESNPLLEAFGNAKTLRNNNSSRFGKYFAIHFNKDGDPCGGQITSYLLEKSRVVFQNVGERCFHIFYCLLAGASQQEAEEWQLWSPDNYFYLNQSQCYEVDGMNDAEEYAAVRHAMDVIQIPAAVQSSIFRLLAGILHLGNIMFQEDQKGNAQPQNPQAFDMPSYLLGIDPHTLQNAILFRVVQTGGPGGKTSTYNVPQNVSQAEGARDSLAKSIYDRLFDFIVLQVNNALQACGASHQYKTHIGVLDIFGFEIFSRNGFEQFCINYVNEKLQQFFIELTLRAEQDEYRAEGIKWEEIKYFNNLVVVELFENSAKGKPTGMFGLMDDVCATVHAQGGFETDLKLLQKMSGLYSGHQHFRSMDTAFAIKHYAGEVTYECQGFTDKNKDTLFPDLVEALQCSSDPFLVSLYPEEVSTSGQKKRPSTAGFKIKTSANELMKALAICMPHYVRTLKPNETKRPHEWDEARVKHQVQYLGLLENVRVRRAGWAYRAEFARFLAKYMKLSRRTWGMWGQWTGDPKAGCVAILEDMHIDTTQWQLGKTKVFVRFPETLFHLEECLERRDYDCISRIQQAWKDWKLRKVALEQRQKAADIMRGKKERQRDSLNRKFLYDYCAYNDNFQLQEVITNGETMVFNDQVQKINRRSRTERRDLVVTNQAVYLVMRQQKDSLIYYKVKTRTPLREIKKVSMSTLRDNFFIVHTSSQGDFLLDNEHKTEIVTLLKEECDKLGCSFVINFADNLSYVTDKGDERQVQFQKSESNQKAVIKKQFNKLSISISSGESRDTDTAPKHSGANIVRNAAAPAARGARGGARGGAGGARGGAAGGGGGRTLPAPAHDDGGGRSLPNPGAGAARGGGAASRGGGGAAAGGPARGGGPGPARGGGGAAAGPARGGGAAAGGPARGGGGAAGGPARGGGAAAGGPARGGAAAGGPARGGAAAAGGPARGGAAGAARGGGAAAAGPGRSLPKPAATAAKPRAKALYDYDAATADELTFREGDVLGIVKEEQEGWWECELQGKRGWVPSNYFEKL